MVAPKDPRALVAVDLGAESCRVSLLRWKNGASSISMVHRFANGPVQQGSTLRWPLQQIIEGVEDGLRQCAVLATEGIASVAVDGWAVDYVRLDASGKSLEEPFCYRDERTVAAEKALHLRIAPQRLREITGIQALRINTLFQMYADQMAASPTGDCWLNLPEFLLHRWGGEAISEFTNATHTQMLDLSKGEWSSEILAAAQLDSKTFRRVVPAGSLLGCITGELALLPAFASTQLIAPACHDTASAIAGIPASGDDWAYISSGTWSLVGTTLAKPCLSAAARDQGFMNLGGVGGSICFHTNVNGMWLVSQCREAWKAKGLDWQIEDLLLLAEQETPPAYLLNVDDPNLLLVGDMPSRINLQLRERGLAEMDGSPAAAPAMLSLILHSLAARYAQVLGHVSEHSGRRLKRVFVVGGGSRNRLLSRLTAEATGLEVIAGASESSTIGNFAVQVAALSKKAKPESAAFRDVVAAWAVILQSRTP